MKILTHDEITRIIQNAFSAGYSAGYQEAETGKRTQDILDYTVKALKEWGELDSK